MSQHRSGDQQQPQQAALTVSEAEQDITDTFTFVPNGNLIEQLCACAREADRDRAAHTKTQRLSKFWDKPFVTGKKLLPCTFNPEDTILSEAGVAEVTRRREAGEHNEWFEYRA